MIGEKVLTLGDAWPIVEETPRLWVAHEPMGYGHVRKWRFPKKGGEMREAKNERGHTRKVFMSEAMRTAFIKAEDERRWVSEHAWGIAKKVQYFSGDAAVLKEIARLVGYEEPAPRS